MDKFAKNKRRAYRPKPPFAIVEGAGTPLFKKLDPEAVWVLLQLYAKFNGRNRTNLSLTYRETRETMSERVFSRAIWQLLGYGFVDVQRWGRLERNCTLYGLSDRWRRLCAPEAEDRRAKIEDLLNERIILERTRTKKESSERDAKHARMAVIRKSIFDAQETMATNN